MNVVLTILSGAREGARLVIKPGETCIVGRSAAAQFSFGDDDHMSGLHMEIGNLGDYATVRDRHSTNGTWLNQVETSKAELKHGDRVRAGKTLFLVEIQNANQPRVIEASPIISDPLVADSNPGVPSLSRFMRTAASQAGSSSSQVTPSSVVIAGDASSALPAEGDSVAKGNSATPQQLAEERPTHRVGQDESDSRIASSGLQLPSAAYLLVNGLNGDRLKLFAQEAGACSNENLRTSLERLQETKQVRVIAHFAKLGFPTPIPIGAVTPVFSHIPQAAQYLPVILSWGAWEHATVVGLTPKLLLHDALMVIVCEHDCDIEATISSVGEQGLPGFSMPLGFLNWCWPSSLIALTAMASLHGLEQAVGDKIQGIIFPDPAFPARMLGLVDVHQPEITEAFGLHPSDSV